MKTNELIQVFENGCFSSQWAGSFNMSQQLCRRGNLWNFHLNCILNFQEEKNKPWTIIERLESVFSLADFRWWIQFPIGLKSCDWLAINCWSSCERLLSIVIELLRFTFFSFSYSAFHFENLLKILEVKTWIFFRSLYINFNTFRSIDVEYKLKCLYKW